MEDVSNAHQQTDEPSRSAQISPRWNDGASGGDVMKVLGNREIEERGPPVDDFNRIPDLNKNQLRISFTSQLKQRNNTMRRSKFKINFKDDGNASVPDHASNSHNSKLGAASSVGFHHHAKSHEGSKSVSKVPMTNKLTRGNTIHSTSEKNTLSNYEVVNMVGELVAKKVIKKMDVSEIPKLIGNPNRKKASTRNDINSQHSSWRKKSNPSSQGRVELGDRSCRELEESWQLQDAPLVSKPTAPDLRVRYDGPLVIRANIVESKLKNDYVPGRPGANANQKFSREKSGATPETDKKNSSTSPRLRSYRQEPADTSPGFQHDEQTVELMQSPVEAFNNQQAHNNIEGGSQSMRRTFASMSTSKRMASRHDKSSSKQSKFGKNRINLDLADCDNNLPGTSLTMKIRSRGQARNKSIDQPMTRQQQLLRLRQKIEEVIGSLEPLDDNVLGHQKYNRSNLNKKDLMRFKNQLEHLSREYQKRRSSFGDIVLENGENLVNLQLPYIQMFNGGTTEGGLPPVIGRFPNQGGHEQSQYGRDGKRSLVNLPDNSTNYRIDGQNSRRNDYYDNMNDQNNYNTKNNQQIQIGYQKIQKTNGKLQRKSQNRRPHSELELSLRQSLNIESIKNQKANKYGSQNYKPSLTQIYDRGLQREQPRQLMQKHLQSEKIETIGEISKEQTLIHPGGETERNNQVGSIESRDSQALKGNYNLSNMLISHPEIYKKKHQQQQSRRQNRSSNMQRGHLNQQRRRNSQPQQTSSQRSSNKSNKNRSPLQSRRQSSRRGSSVENGGSSMNNIKNIKSSIDRQLDKILQEEEEAGRGGGTKVEALTDGFQQSKLQMMMNWHEETYQQQFIVMQQEDLLASKKASSVGRGTGQVSQIPVILLSNSNDNSLLPQTEKQTVIVRSPIVFSQNPKTPTKLSGNPAEDSAGPPSTANFVTSTQMKAMNMNMQPAFGNNIRPFDETNAQPIDLLDSSDRHPPRSDRPLGRMPHPKARYPMQQNEIEYIQQHIQSMNGGTRAQDPQLQQSFNLNLHQAIAQESSRETAELNAPTSGRLASSREYKQQLNLVKVHGGKQDPTGLFKGRVGQSSDHNNSRKESLGQDTKRTQSSKQSAADLLNSCIEHRKLDGIQTSKLIEQLNKQGLPGMHHVLISARKHTGNSMDSNYGGSFDKQELKIIMMKQQQYEQQQRQQQQIQSKMSTLAGGGRGAGNALASQQISEQEMPLDQTQYIPQSPDHKMDTMNGSNNLTELDVKKMDSELMRAISPASLRYSDRDSRKSNSQLQKSDLDPKAAQQNLPPQAQSDQQMSRNVSKERTLPKNGKTSNSSRDYAIQPRRLVKGNPESDLDVNIDDLTLLRPSNAESNQFTLNATGGGPVALTQPPPAKGRSQKQTVMVFNKFDQKRMIKLDKQINSMIEKEDAYNDHNHYVNARNYDQVQSFQEQSGIHSDADLIPNALSGQIQSPKLVQKLSGDQNSQNYNLYLADEISKEMEQFQKHLQEKEKLKVKGKNDAKSRYVLDSSKMQQSVCKPVLQIQKASIGPKPQTTKSPRPNQIEKIDTVNLQRIQPVLGSNERGRKDLSLSDLPGSAEMTETGAQEETHRCIGTSPMLLKSGPQKSESAQKEDQQYPEPNPPASMNARENQFRLMNELVIGPAGEQINDQSFEKQIYNRLNEIETSNHKPISTRQDLDTKRSMQISSKRQTDYNTKFNSFRNKSISSNMNHTNESQRPNQIERKHHQYFESIRRRNLSITGDSVTIVSSSNMAKTLQTQKNLHKKAHGYDAQFVNQFIQNRTHQSTSCKYYESDLIMKKQTLKEIQDQNSQAVDQGLVVSIDDHSQNNSSSKTKTNNVSPNNQGIQQTPQIHIRNQHFNIHETQMRSTHQMDLDSFIEINGEQQNKNSMDDLDKTNMNLSQINQMTLNPFQQNIVNSNSAERVESLQNKMLINQKRLQSMRNNNSRTDKSQVNNTFTKTTSRTHSQVSNDHKRGEHLITQNKFKNTTQPLENDLFPVIHGTTIHHPVSNTYADSKQKFNLLIYKPNEQEEIASAKEPGSAIMEGSPALVLGNKYFNNQVSVDQASLGTLGIANQQSQVTTTQNQQMNPFQFGSQDEQNGNDSVASPKFQGWSTKQSTRRNSMMHHLRDKNQRYIQRQTHRETVLMQNPFGYGSRENQTPSEHNISSQLQEPSVQQQSMYNQINIQEQPIKIEYNKKYIQEENQQSNDDSPSVLQQQDLARHRLISQDLDNLSKTAFSQLYHDLLGKPSHVRAKLKISNSNAQYVKNIYHQQIYTLQNQVQPKKEYERKFYLNQESEEAELNKFLGRVKLDDGAMVPPRMKMNMSVCDKYKSSSQHDSGPGQDDSWRKLPKEVFQKRMSVQHIQSYRRRKGRLGQLSKNQPNQREKNGREHFSKSTMQSFNSTQSNFSKSLQNFAKLGAKKLDRSRQSSLIVQQSSPRSNNKLMGQTYTQKQHHRDSINLIYSLSNVRQILLPPAGNPSPPQPYDSRNFLESGAVNIEENSQSQSPTDPRKKLSLFKQISSQMGEQIKRTSKKMHAATPQVPEGTNVT